MARWRLPRTVVDVAHLVWGAGAAQLLVLLATIVCARWFFTDAELGELATAVGIATILATAATLRLEMAIPLARTDREALDLTRVVLAVSLVVALVVSAAVALLSLAGSQWLAAELGGSAGWVGAGLFATAGYQTLRMLQTRLGQFKAASTANVGGAAVTGLTQVLAGAARLGSGGLTAGFVVGRLVTVMGMARSAAFAARGRLRWWLVGKWRRIPLWMVLPAVLNALSVSAVAPLVQAWYGKELAGQLGLAQRLLMAPAALLGQAVAGVFFARFAAMRRAGQSTTTTVGTVAEALASLSLPVFVPFVLLGPDIFGLLVGSSWQTAGVMASLLSPWLMLNFVSSPLSSYATVEDRLLRLFVLSLVEAGLRVPALATGLWWGDVRTAVAWYGLAGLVISTYWAAWVIRLSGGTWGSVLRVLGPSVGVLGVCALLAAGRPLLPGSAYVAVSAAVIVLAALGGAVRLSALVRPIMRGTDEGVRR